MFLLLFLPVHNVDRQDFSVFLLNLNTALIVLVQEEQEDVLS